MKLRQYALSGVACLMTMPVFSQATEPEAGFDLTLSVNVGLASGNSQLSI